MRRHTGVSLTIGLDGIASCLALPKPFPFGAADPGPNSLVTQRAPLLERSADELAGMCENRFDICVESR